MQINLGMVFRQPRIWLIISAIIAGVVVCALFVLEIIPAHIEACGDAVGVGETMRNLGIDIIESVVGGTPDPPYNRVEEKSMHSSCTDGISGVRTAERPFEMQFLRQKSHAYRAVESIGIAVIRPDIKDAGHAASIACRERALVHCDLLD